MATAARTYNQDHTQGDKKQTNCRGIHRGGRTRDMPLADCSICSDGLGRKGGIYISPLKSLIASTDSQEGTWKSAT